MVDEQITGNMHTTGTCAAFQRKKILCNGLCHRASFYVQAVLYGLNDTYLLPMCRRDLLRLQRYVELVKFISACLLNTV